MEKPVVPNESKQIIVECDLGNRGRRLVLKSLVNKCSSIVFRKASVILLRVAGIEFGMPRTQRGIVMLCGIKRPLMSRRGSFSVTIRCSFVGWDHQWVVTEQRLCFERSSMGRVRGCGRLGSLAFYSVPSGVLSLTIRNHWFLGKRDH